MNSPVIISRIIHPETNEVLAFEIVDNEGKTFYCERPGGALEGMRFGKFPNYNSERGIGLPMARVEIARLELEA